MLRHAKVSVFPRTLQSPPSRTVPNTPAAPLTRKSRCRKSLPPWSPGLTFTEQLMRLEGAIDAKALAVLLGVSEISVYRAAKRGLIPCFRIGTCVRFDPCSVARRLFGTVTRPQRKGGTA